MPNVPKKGLTHVSVKLDAEMLARLDQRVTEQRRTWRGGRWARTDEIRLMLDASLPKTKKRAKP